MNIEDINLGDPPTGAGGDTMRTAFGKTNQNFGAAKQALEDEVQTREQLLATQRDQLIALIESVNGPLPSLRADFKARSFGSKNAAGLFLPCDYSDLFTLSAPSPKWVWNAQGQLVEVPAGQPAWDHDPITGEPLGQVLRDEETNYAFPWAIRGGGTDGRATTELVQEKNPFNLNEVLKVSQSVDDPNFYVYRNGVEARIGDNTFTFAVKCGSGVKAIGAETSGSQPLYFRYDIDTGLITNRADNSVKLKNLKDGFIQFSVTAFNYQYTAELISVVAEPREGSGGTADAYFFTAAWNYNHSATFGGHIITNESAVHRAADVASAEDSFLDNFDSSQGWLFIEYDLDSDGFALQLETEGATNNYNSFYIESSSITLFDHDSVALRSQGDYAGRHKVLLLWKSGIISAYADGGLLFSGEYAVPQWVRALFFRRTNGATPGNGYLIDFRMGDVISHEDAIARTTL